MITGSVFDEIVIFFILSQVYSIVSLIKILLNNFKKKGFNLLFVTGKKANEVI